MPLMAHHVRPPRLLVHRLVCPLTSSHRKSHVIHKELTSDIFHSSSSPGLTGGSLSIIGGVLAFLFLVVCISSYWMRSMLKKQQEMGGAELPLHTSSVGSQSSTLVQTQRSHLVSPPPSESSVPTTVPVPNLEAPLPSPNLLPGHNIYSSASPLPPTSLASSQFSQSTKIPDQHETGYRIDNRSNKSKVVFNFTSRH